MNRKDLMKDMDFIYKEKSEVGFIFDVATKNEDPTTEQIKNLEKLTGPEKEKSETKTHFEIIHDFIANNNIV